MKWVIFRAFALISCARMVIDASTCPSATVYSGQWEVFPLFDTWLSDTGTPPSTSSCGNEKSFFINKNDKFVAISYVPMDYGTGCGRCINLTSSTGATETLTVIEGINKANDGDIQISTSLSNRLGGTQVSWQFVPCPISGNIQYQFEPGATTSNSPWIGFSNFAYGIKAVSATIGGKSYQLQRSSNTVNWNLPQGTLQLPLIIQLTSMTNEKVQFTVATINGDSSFSDSRVAFTGTCFEPPTTIPTYTTLSKATSKSSSEVSLSRIAAILVITVGIVIGTLLI